MLDEPLNIIYHRIESMQSPKRTSAVVGGSHVPRACCRAEWIAFVVRSRNAACEISKHVTNIVQYRESLVKCAKARARTPQGQEKRRNSITETSYTLRVQYTVQI